MKEFIDDFENNTEGDFTVELEYDDMNRLKHHPEIHFATGKIFKDHELEYLCKFWEVDGLKTISMALGKTEASTGNILNRLKKNGQYDYYRSLKNYV